MTLRSRHRSVPREGTRRQWWRRSASPAGESSAAAVVPAAAAVEQVWPAVADQLAGRVLTLTELALPLLDRLEKALETYPADAERLRLVFQAEHRPIHQLPTAPEGYRGERPGWQLAQHDAAAGGDR